MACIWYISKYVSPPAQTSSGGRGYMLMREIAALGYQTVIITSDSNQLAQVPDLKQAVVMERVDGLTLCWLRTMKYQVAKSARRILSWIDFEWRLLRLPKKALPRPEVVVVSSLSLLTVLNGFLLRWRFKCRLVLEIRDIWPLTITEEGGFSARNPLVLGLGLIEWMGYRFADAVVGTMPNLQEHVAQVLGRPRQTYCIPMGVDEDALQAAESVPEDYVQAHLPKDKFLIAHAGTIGITNALDTFLECAQALQSDSRLHFLVVGDGDLRLFYQKKYAHLRNLSFAPRVKKSMVQSVLSRCDLLYFSVHPSKVWRYGQSLNKVIDYMLAGKPVLASYTGYPSMINEAECGSYVPAGSVDELQREILRYANMDPQERARMGERGRQWVLANRRYPVLARQYLEILFSTQPGSGALA
jgi:glycosyltransferase involved in cell wall biosynthesis